MSHAPPGSGPWTVAHLERVLVRVDLFLLLVESKRMNKFQGWTETTTLALATTRTLVKNTRMGLDE